MLSLKEEMKSEFVIRLSHRSSNRLGSTARFSRPSRQTPTLMKACLYLHLLSVTAVFEEFGPFYLGDSSVGSGVHHLQYLVSRATTVMAKQKTETSQWLHGLRVSLFRFLDSV